MKMQMIENANTVQELLHLIGLQDINPDDIENVTILKGADWSCAMVIEALMNCL